MNSSDEQLSPAERRVVEHLEVIRAAPPESDQRLTRRILSKAQRQHALRAPLEFAGVIVAAALDAVTGLIGRSGGRRR